MSVGVKYIIERETINLKFKKDYYIAIIMMSSLESSIFLIRKYRRF